MGDAQLRTYLQDHYAGSAGGMRLAKQVLGHNEGTAVGSFARRLIASIEADRAVLREVMHRIDVKPAPLKEGVGWFTGQASGLVLRLPLQAAPLRRVLELESLISAITGRVSLWQVLQHACGRDPRFEHLDFAARAKRALEERELAETLRLEAARQALHRRASDALPSLVRRIATQLG